MGARTFLSIPVQGSRLSKSVYDAIIVGAQNAGLHLVNLEVNNPPSTTQLADISPEVVHAHNLALLEGCRLVIAEVSRPSLGVGYELAVAQARRLPILALCDAVHLHELSLMIRGIAFERFAIASYQQIEDVAGLISVFAQANLRERDSPPSSGDVTQIDEHFNKLAPDYDESTEWRQNQTMLNWMASKLVHRQLCLDIGTGTGIVGAHIRLGGAEVVGIDRSGEMLRRAAARLNWVAQGDCASLPFRASSFDGVALRSVLHYVDDVRCLQEVRRVLKDDGIFVCAQATGANVEAAAWWGRLKRLTQPLRQRFYTESILQQRFASAGLQVLETASIRMSRREKWEGVLRHCAPTESDHARAMLHAAPSYVRDDAQLEVDEDGISYEQHWTLLTATPAEHL